MSLSGELTRDSAREAALRELSRRQYVDDRPSLLARVVARLGRELARLLDSASHAVGNGVLARVLLVLVLLVVVTVVLLRLGPLARGAARAPLFPDGSALSAAEHRAAAQDAAALGRWPDAVRERLRAVVRELEVRGVLDARPGRTAGEVARDGGAELPGLAADLHRAAAVFEQVWYGGRVADRESYDLLVAVDERVVRERLVGA